MQFLNDITLRDKTVLIREDFNVPIKDGKIQDHSRIASALVTIKYVLEQAKRVILVSHLGRPQEGMFDEKYSLRLVAQALAKQLNQQVELIYDWQDGISSSSKIVLLENVRFYDGEEKNDPALAKKLAGLADVVIFDAFATAHRAQASTVGMINEARVAAAGFLLEQELNAIDKAWHNPTPPVVAIVGGAKISTKLTLLHQLAKKVDVLIPGGGIANTLLMAQGLAIGASLVEPELINSAKVLLQDADCEILLPTDVIVAKEISNDAVIQVKSVAHIDERDMILDIGPDTAALYSTRLTHAKTVIWNGPLGVFEYQPFQTGTRKVAESIAASKAYSLVGGGDTLSALAQFGLLEDMSYVSTGGGALLSYLEGCELPAIQALEKKGT